MSETPMSWALCSLVVVAKPDRFKEGSDRRLKKLTDPAGGLTEFGYDVLGRLASVKDPRNNVASSNNRLNSVSATGTRVRSYTQAIGIRNKVWGAWFAPAKREGDTGIGVVIRTNGSFNR